MIKQYNQWKKTHFYAVCTLFTLIGMDFHGLKPFVDPAEEPTQRELAQERLCRRQEGEAESYITLERHIKQNKVNFKKRDVWDKLQAIKNEQLHREEIKNIRTPANLFPLAKLAAERNKNKTAMLLLDHMNYLLNEGIRIDGRRTNKGLFPGEAWFRKKVEQKRNDQSLQKLKSMLPTEQILINQETGKVTVDNKAIAQGLPSKILAAVRNYDWNGRTPEATRSIVLQMLKKMNGYGVDLENERYDGYEVEPEMFIKTAVNVPEQGENIVEDALYYSKDLREYVTKEFNKCKADLQTVLPHTEAHQSAEKFRKSAKILRRIRTNQSLKQYTLQNVSWAEHSPLQEAVKYGHVPLVKEIVGKKGEKPKTRLTSPTELEQDGSCMLLTAAEGIAQAKDSNVEENIKQSLAHVVHKARQQGVPFNVEGPGMETPWLRPILEQKDTPDMREQIKKADTYIFAYRLALTLYNSHITKNKTHISRAAVIKDLIQAFPSNVLGAATDEQLAKILEGQRINIHPRREPESIWKHLVHAYFESEEPFDITAILKAFGKENFTQKAKDDVEDAFEPHEDQDTYEQRTTELQQAFKDIFGVTITPDE